MKIAVFIYGEFREFDSVIKYWDFLNDYDCDVFMSTWDYSFQENENLGYRREKIITEEMIKNILPNAKISVLKESDHYLDYDLPNEKKKRTKRVVLHWKNCLKMMKESGKEYDIIILNRTDNFTIFKLDDEYLNEISKQEDRIYGLNNIYLCAPNKFHLMDLIFFGSRVSILKIIENCPDDLDCIHHDLSQHIISCNLFVDKVKKGHVDIGVFRPNSLEMIDNNENIDIHKIAQKHIIWEETMKKQ